VKKIPAAKL